jgi:Protein of unknown function (DUF1761)
MTPNLAIAALAALIPLIMGFIWYNPKVFGTAWMNLAGLTEEKMKGTNMPLVFILSYIFAFMMALAIMGIVIHQGHVYSILVKAPGFGVAGSPVQTMLEGFMRDYGQNFRTFKHGVFHGVLFSIFFVLPLIATGAMFERKSFKYIFLNWGYWLVTISLMGGVICQFA